MNTQKKVYDRLYQEKDYKDFEMPDYKITGDKKIRDKNILVLGVGTGRDVWYLAGENDVYGLDVSDTAIKVATKHKIKVKTANLTEPLKFKNEFFDIVVAKDILEHLENPMDLLKEIRRVLKKSGYAVISVPNHFYFPFRLRILFGKNLIWKTIGHDHTKLFNEWDYMHIRFFTWGGFQKFMEKSGFRIVRKFWDFGTLAHYSQPEMVFEYLRQKKFNKNILLLLGVVWRLFNLVIPRSLRWKIVDLTNGSLCAGFYVWVKKG